MLNLLMILPFLIEYVCATDSKNYLFTRQSAMDSILPSENILGTSWGSRIDCNINCVQIPQCLSTTFHQKMCRFYSTFNFTSSVTSVAVGAMTFILNIDFTPPPGYTCVPSLKWCYKLVDTRLSWLDAKDACVAEGTTLLTIQSSYEQDIINKELKSIVQSFHWIGIHDKYNEGQFEDIHGNTLLFTWWESQHSQPNNYNDQDCVAFHPPLEGWFDDRCSATHKFICEKRFT